MIFFFLFLPLLNTEVKTWGGSIKLQEKVRGGRRNTGALTSIAERKLELFNLSPASNQHAAAFSVNKFIFVLSKILMKGDIHVRWGIVANVFCLGRIIEVKRNGGSVALAMRPDPG